MENQREFWKYRNAEERKNTAGKTPAEEKLKGHIFRTRRIKI